MVVQGHLQLRTELEGAGHTEKPRFKQKTRQEREERKMIEKKWTNFGFCYSTKPSPYNKQMPTHPIAIQLSKYSVPCVHVARVCMCVYIVHE